ncbi:TDP-N-acetylfucosamine:lipid II N-acetylfucosaminyltransferase [Acinetobacter indicus]
MSKNLHVCTLDKFIPPFLKFIRDEFEKEKNEFYMIGDNIKYPYQRDTYTVQHCGFLYYLLLIRSMYSADKIILHGLFSFQIILILALNPKLLKKSYWVIWGGDLYTFMFPKKALKYKLKEVLRSFVIKRLGFLLTYVKGDVDLARKHYRAGGQYLETIGYLSNVIPSNILVSNNKKNINILVGNSADPSNNHFDALDKLAKFKNENIQIYAPLSYGNKEYAKKVIEKGSSLFGDKFIGITEFMPYSEYMYFLKDIDIAIFNHKRQQAMGNTINLLAMGKKVYLREGTTQKEFFNDLAVQTFNIDNIDISINFSGKKNTQILEKYFSRQNLAKQWKRILED